MAAWLGCGHGLAGETAGLERPARWCLEKKQRHPETRRPFR